MFIIFLELYLLMVGKLVSPLPIIHSFIHIIHSLIHIIHAFIQSFIHVCVLGPSFVIASLLALLATCMSVYLSVCLFVCRLSTWKRMRKQRRRKKKRRA